MFWLTYNGFSYRKILAYLTITNLTQTVVKHTPKTLEFQIKLLKILRIVTFKLPLSEWKKLGK